MKFSRRLSKTFFIYVFKSFFTAMTCCLGGFITLFMVIQLFDVLPDFISNKVSLGYMVEYFLLTMPQQLLFAVLPISVLLSASFMVISMTMKHEITALRSAGISLFGYFLPVWLICFVLSCGGLVLTYYPLASSWMVEGQGIIELLETPELLANRDSKTSPVTFNNNRDSSRQWVFGAYRKEGLKEKVFVRQYYTVPGKPTEIEWELNAAMADYNEQKGKWCFYDFRLVRMDKNKIWSEEILQRWQETGLMTHPVQGSYVAKDGTKTGYFADGVIMGKDGQWILKNVIVETFSPEGKRLSSEETAQLVMPNLKKREELAHFMTKDGFEHDYHAWFKSIEEVDYLKVTITFTDFMRAEFDANQKISRFEIWDSYLHLADCNLKYLKLMSLEDTEDINPLVFHQEEITLWAPFLTYQVDGANSVWEYKKGLCWKQGRIEPPFVVQDGQVPLFATRAYRGERIFDENPDRILNSTAKKDELCIRELRQIVRRVKTLSPELQREYWITIWNRAFTSFMPLIAAFLGIAFSLIKERINPVSGFAKATGVMLSFYAVDQMIILLGIKGWLPLPAIIIGGGVTVIYLIFGIVMMWRKQ